VGLLANLGRMFWPPAARAVEGQYRPGPWNLPITGGWLTQQAGQYMNWWQLGYDPVGFGSGAMVEACVSAYSQTVAMMPGDHWLSHDDGGRERVKLSALTRILRRPNDYQSISDFLLNAVRWLYSEGNAYALCLRNDRFEISELHLMSSRQSKPQVASTGDIFYHLAGNEVIEARIAQSGAPAGILSHVPARDVLHLRLHTPRHPLIGCTPLEAAALEIAATNAAMSQQIQFYLNQARPSFVLSTDQLLTREQIEQVRALWEQHSSGLNQGGTPILSQGLKVQPIATSSRDAQLAEVLKMSDAHIALVYRVPLQILGLGGSPFASTETLMNFWLANGLNFALNHIEEAVGNKFGLKGQPDEYLELNTSVLLRADTQQRIESLVRAVQGGLKSPNEARAEENLPAAEEGDEPRLQAQVVPLTAWQQPMPTAPSAPSAPAAVKPGGGSPADEPAAEDDTKEEALSQEVIESVAFATMSRELAREPGNV
jgi:HK97 family phage portal protein